METRTNTTNRTRTHEAALELVRSMEADLWEIRDRLLRTSAQGPDTIAISDNTELNSIRREVRLLLLSVGEGTA